MIEGTSDIEPVDALAMPGSAHDIQKRANSAFLGTDFEEQLRNLDVKKLVLAGAFIDGCVGLTAADAAQRGFEVIIAEDATAHCDLRHREMMIEWLIRMFELTVVKAEAIHTLKGFAQT
jgi:nicotinamidase-related amidase